MDAPLPPLPSLDRLVGLFDVGLRTLAGAHAAARGFPGEAREEASLTEAERDDAAALMRVNHVGEVCAQALYAGQSLTARDPVNREALDQAAREEVDHLVWSEQRLRELDGRTSLLNPLWFAGAFALGTVAGALGDRWSLAFLAETERQVEDHLNGHLERLPTEDGRTRAVVEAMRDDEIRHRATAVSLGAAELPAPVRQAMRGMAKIMTTVAYRI